MSKNNRILAAVLNWANVVELEVDLVVFTSGGLTARFVGKIDELHIPPHVFTADDFFMSQIVEQRIKWVKFGRPPMKREPLGHYIPPDEHITPDHK